MKLTTHQGIVIRRIRHLEEDAKLTLLLRDEGKIIATIKGGQKLTSKVRVLQEPFIKADFQLFLPPHGPYGRVIQGRLINSHQGFRTNLLSFQLASQACEIVDMLLPFRAASPETFDLLDHTLHEFEVAPDPIDPWILFALHLFRQLGHGEAPPEILRCVTTSSAKDRCLAYVDAELQRILPQQLKTDIFKVQL
jgi:DNA repair protein RecO